MAAVIRSSDIFQKVKCLPLTTDKREVWRIEGIKKIINYWRYFGYKKEILHPYDEQIAADNLKTFSRALVVAGLTIVVELALISLLAISGQGVTESLWMTARLMLVAVAAIVAMGIVYRQVQNSRSKALWSRILTTVFLSLWSVLYIIIGTVIDSNDYAVMACGLLLLVQVMFNSYPVENLMFVLSILGVFLTIDFINKPRFIFSYDLLDSLPFLFVGLFLSWIKSRSKWDSLIHADAMVQLETQKLENELLESRISVMLSQIQPHFLYNALGVIYHLCDKDPKAAKQATADFSRYLRTNLDSLRMDAPVLFETELQHVQIYLSLEKMRFGEELEVVYEIQAEGFLIPVLTIQPLVENAVKYGVGKKPGGGTVTISSQEVEGYYQITVSDNGVGFDPCETQEDGRSHIGIENVKRRLWAMSEAKLEIKSEKGVGTTATITIPGGGKERECDSSRR